MNRQQRRMQKRRGGLAPLHAAPAASGTAELSQRLVSQYLTNQPGHRDEAALHPAIQYHRAGRLQEAKAAYREAIAADPENIGAYNNLGSLLLDEGDTNAAQALFERAATMNPNHVETLNNLGTVQRAAGNIAASLAHFEAARQVNPTYVPTYINLGLLFEACGRFDRAIDCYRDGLSANATQRELHLALGSALERSGLTNEAIVCYQQAIALDPNYVEPLNNLGCICQSRGEFDAALAWFERAIQANPGFATTHVNLGLLYESFGKLDLAIKSYREGIRINPDLAEAHLNLGNALQHALLMDEAIVCYEQAIALKPDFATAYANLGVALEVKCKFPQAIAALEHALRLDPDHLIALHNLGKVMSSVDRIDEAVVCYERVLGLQPGHAAAQSNLLLALNYPDSVSAQELARRSFEIAAATERNVAAAPLPYDRRPSPGGRLRVGYVSPDFRRHAVPYFLTPLLQAHDRCQMEIFCYAEVSRPDEVTARFQSLADHWRWTVGVGDDDLATLIRADGIDVLVDLAGHSANNRLPVFARRPAPVQFTWLGYPGTTGLSSIGYRVVDAITDPPGDADRLASETLLRIDGGFLCYQPPPEAPEPAPWQEHRAITFGSFNNLAKLSHATLDLWARLLTLVPNARLLLKSAHFEEDEAKHRMLARLRERGIAADRVILIGRSETVSDQLAAYRDVDIALDPFPYNGTTTTCETLWMGVPVVTLLGDSHRSRVGASLLTQIGRTDLIARDHDDYLRIAAELAADPSRLGALHQTLRSDMAASGLCDAAAFARKMESAYRTAWQRWRAGQDAALQSAAATGELRIDLADGTRLLVPASLDSVTTYVALEQEKWFEKEADFVARWLQPGMTAIDIGANVGIYSLAMARRVGPDGRVFAYEPAADTCAMLRRARSLNEADNLTVIQAALSDRAGMGCLTHGTSSETNQLRDNGEGESVRVTCLDDEASQFDFAACDFMKIDAEGHEAAILRGGRAFFARHSPLVMFEISNDTVGLAPPRGILTELGYGIFRLLAGAPVLVPYQAQAPDAYELNLFAAKPDRAAAMAQQGWLVQAIPDWIPDDDARAQALAPLRQLPWAPSFAALLNGEPALDPEYLDCLAAFSIWRSLDLPLPARCGALEFAWRGLLAINERTTTFARLLTLCRVAAEAGQRAVSVRALRHFLAAARQATVVLNEPFWPASRRFDALLPNGDSSDWIVASAAEQLELSGHFSAAFTGPTAEQEFLCTSRFASAEIHRRRVLAAVRTGLQVDIPPPLETAAPDHINAALWRSRQVLSIGSPVPPVA